MHSWHLQRITEETNVSSHFRMLALCTRRPSPPMDERLNMLICGTPKSAISPSCTTGWLLRRTNGQRPRSYGHVCDHVEDKISHLTQRYRPASAIKTRSLGPLHDNPWYPTAGMAIGAIELNQPRPSEGAFSTRHRRRCAMQEA